MRELKNWTHPYFSCRSVKSWDNNGKFIQIIDVRDIYHGQYSVEIEDGYGGLESIYASPDLDKCIEFVNRHFN